MLFKHGSVIGLCTYRPDNSKCDRILRIGHSCQSVMYPGIRLVGIMDKDILFRYALLTQFNHFQFQVFKNDTLVTVLPKDHWLTVMQHNGVVISGFLVGDGI